MYADYPKRSSSSICVPRIFRDITLNQTFITSFSIFANFLCSIMQSAICLRFRYILFSQFEVILPAHCRRWLLFHFITFSDTHTHLVGLLWRSYRSVAETTHRQTSMPPAGLEFAVPESEGRTPTPQNTQPPGISRLCTASLSKQRIGKYTCPIS